jgi:CspA family cold shock protein
MCKGKVKYFNEHKGWGIIANNETEQDVYVHYTAINMDGYKTLKQGQDVHYDLSHTDHGPSARNVTLA